VRLADASEKRRLMRALIVVHGFPPQTQGGSEIYAHAHAQALRRDFGDDVLVLTREHDATQREYAVRKERLDGLQVVRINNTFLNARTFEDTYRNETIDGIAAGVIDEFKPDVAHIHHLTCLSTGIVGQLEERRIPRFLTLHDYWLICHRGQLLDVDCQCCENVTRDAAAMCSSCLDPAVASDAGFFGARVFRAVTRYAPGPAARLRRSGLRFATVLGADTDGPAKRRTSHMQDVCGLITQFIAPSRFMRDRFVAFGIAGERITVADYGFDAGPFRSMSRTPRNGPLRVGFLGSLMISKAPHVLLESVGRLPLDVVSVTVYGEHTPYHGDDTYRDRLSPLVAQPNVSLRGPLSHADVPKALAALDVLVVPSIWPENSPLVIHEAFLAGVPVIGSDIGGIPELVMHEVNGLLFRAGDVDGLARALLRVAGDRGLLQKLRDGIPPVRSIETDVQELRAMYQRTQITR
jgi:glycosyltransferase involved in cell wall biosynthesis